MKKIDKITYQLIPSTHKGFKEVLVTFNYKGESVHYYSFIKEKGKKSNKQYIDEAKKEIAKLIKNGKLARYARKYLHYPIKESKKVKTITVVKTVVAPQGKSAAPVNVKTKKPHIAIKPYFPFLILCVFGIICLIAAITIVIVNLVNVGSWPREWLIPENEMHQITHLYYLSIVLGAVAVVLLAAGIPLFIKKFRNGGHVAAPKAKKKK